MKMKKVMLWLGAFVFLTLGVFIILIFLASFFGGKPSQNSLQTDLSYLVFLGLAPTGAGIWCLLRFRENSKKEHYDSLQLKVLQIAKKNQGVVGLSELSVELNYPLKQMEGIMDYLVKYGFARMELKEQGHIYYEFLDFKNPG